MSSTQPRRLMIVEDEALILNLMSVLMGGLGYDVTETASHLEDGLRKAGEVDVDVACLDVNLAGEMSFPIAEKLRERGIPFLFVTGYGRAGIPAGLAGVTVVNKPFTSRHLARALQDTLDRTTPAPS